MSRIGKQPVVIPAGVKVAVEAGKVRVEGPKGKLELEPHPAMKVAYDDKTKAITIVRPDDERLREALQIAEREGLDYKFEKVTIADAAHPNTVRISIELDGNKATMLGSSLGAGRILVQEIDGYPVQVTGNFHTIVLVAEDRKGSIARITGILAEHDINIATLRLSRKERGGDAFMMIECDEEPDKKAGEELRALDWVRWTRRLPKVSGG